MRLLERTRMLYPGFPNIHEKNRAGLVDLGDVMDVVCDEAHWNEQFLSNCRNVRLLNVRHHKPRPLRHQNQPGFHDFVVYVEKYGEA